MKIQHIISGLLLGAFFSCEELERPNINQFVVEGFITADATVDDIKVKQTVALDDDIEDIPITNAAITLMSEEQDVLLNYNNTIGKYFDQDQVFPVRVGQQYDIEIVVDGVTANASTVVPEKPVNLALSKTALVVPTLILNFSLRDQISDLFENEVSTFSWSGEPGQSYFVVIENKEEVLDPILPEGIPEESLELLGSFRFISAPSEATSFDIIAIALETYGRHVAKVYSVNQEYVDLFNSETQDSRDLNDPPSNITNGLGIFTAFAVDSLEFEVRRE